MDEELPEGIEEKIILMPVESLLITCPKCNKELELQTIENLVIDPNYILCTNPLVWFLLD